MAFNLPAAASIRPNIFSVVIADRISLNAPFSFCSSAHARALRSAVALPISHNSTGATGSVASNIAAVIQSTASALIKNIGSRISVDATCGSIFTKNSPSVPAASNVSVKFLSYRQLEFLRQLQKFFRAD